MKLVIVESPTKTKTLKNYLGKDYQVVSTMGHLRDLPKKKLGVDVEKDFKPTYQLVPGKKKAATAIKKAAKKAKKIYLATDPDREGEAIAWHVAHLLKKKEDGLARIVFHEITKKAILKSLKKPGKINLPLVNAQQARRILDRLVGYQLSPVLWRKIRRGLSAGRVQSVAVRLIVDREREIEKFVPQEYWEVWANLKKHVGGQREDVPEFKAKLTKKNNRPFKIKNEITAKETLKELNKANWEVNRVVKKKVKQNPSPPLTTSTLQQQSVLRLGYSAKRTMVLAQSLYEKGLITYHRTDSVALSKEALGKMRNYLEKTFGPDYLPPQPRFFKTKAKVAQEAHEAIRPTNFSTDLKSPPVLKLNPFEKRLYTLIWKRTLASQMASAVWDKTKLIVQAAGQTNLFFFQADGKVIKFDGWLKLYRTKTQKEKQIIGQELPELKENDPLDLLKTESEQKFTQPPPRYSEASLVKTLEEKGIGRPSTYAPTISTIQNRLYVEKEEGKFKPTPLGITVNDFLTEYFPKIMDYEFTAKMEDNLDEIAKGKKEWVPVVKEFYEPFGKKVEAVIKVAERTKVPTEATDQKCPRCQKGLLVIRTGRFGKFLSCSRFPDCRYTAPYNPVVEGVKCEKCGGDVIVKKTKKGRQFYGCANYPDCDWASWRKPRS